MNKYKKFTITSDTTNAVFIVDTSILTEAKALKGLEDFAWDWCSESCVYMQLLTKYFWQLDSKKVPIEHMIQHFNNTTFIPIDGSTGLSLLSLKYSPIAIQSMVESTVTTKDIYGVFNSEHINITNNPDTIKPKRS